jgi:hypothetical protein
LNVIGRTIAKSADNAAIRIFSLIAEIVPIASAALD